MSVKRGRDRAPQLVDCGAASRSGIALASHCGVQEGRRAAAERRTRGKGEEEKMSADGNASERLRKSELVLSQLRGARMVCPGVVGERRRANDRRRVTLWSLLYGGVRPRRRTARREDEDSRTLVDFHDRYLMVIAVGILLLSCADACLTLTLLTLGAQEVNPVMARLIYTDVAWFAGVKIGLTGIGVVVLVTLSRFKVFGRIRVLSTLYFSLAAYTALVLYELALLAYLSPWLAEILAYLS